MPFEHPISGGNLRLAFPDVDTDNLPSYFAPFERADRPSLGVYEVMALEESTYEMVDGVCKEVWHKRDMTAEERLAKQQTTINNFNSQPQISNFSAWVFDEATCRTKPPVPIPDRDQSKIDAGIFTKWCGADNNWKDTPVRPNDGNQYDFDHFAWQWVQVVN